MTNTPVIFTWEGPLHPPPPFTLAPGTEDIAVTAAKTKAVYRGNLVTYHIRFSIKPFINYPLGEYFMEKFEL